MVIELLRRRGDRGTVLNMPAVADPAVFFRAALQISKRHSCRAWRH
jgi:hypothetical protein